MQEETKSIKGKISNRNVADSGGKLIFENPTLCSQLLRDFSGIEILKNVRPEDIEDLTLIDRNDGLSLVMLLNRT